MRIPMDFFQGTDDYIVSPDLRDAVNVAIALEKPLLIKGEPGTGKTRLAEAIAKALGHRLLAWNIKSWHAIMMHRKDDRTGFVRMEFKRFLDTVIRVPAMVLVRARSIVVRLVAYTVNLDRFFSAWATTERTRFGYG